MIEFVRADASHIEPILANLREQEIGTIERLKLDAPRVLRKSISEPSWTTLVDGVPAAMFGISGSMAGTQKLWMLTTPLIEAHQIALLRASRRFVRWARSAYGPLIGMCDRHNEVSRAWLHWLGFVELEDGEFIKMRYE